MPPVLELPYLYDPTKPEPFAALLAYSWKVYWSPSKGQGIDRRIEPNRFRHTEAAIDRLSLKDVVANSRIDVDNILEGLKKDTEIGTMREIMKELHQKALTDRQFSIKLSIVARPDMIKGNDELNATGLRIILVRTLRNNFDARDKLKAMDLKQYRNALSLFGEFYHRCRAKDVEFFPLGETLITWLRDLLRDTEEEDVELVARQLSINGQLLKDEAAMDLDGLLNCVKRRLINRNVSAKSRILMLFILDLADQGFAPLTGDQRDFYVKKLGPYTFADFEFCGRHVNDQDHLKPKVVEISRSGNAWSKLHARHPQSFFRPVSERLNRHRIQLEPGKLIEMPFATIRPVIPTFPEDKLEKFFFPRRDEMDQIKINPYEPDYEPEKPILMPFASANQVIPTLPEDRLEKFFFPRSDAMNQNKSNHKTEYEPEKPIHMPFSTVNPVIPTFPEDRLEKFFFPRRDEMNQNKSNHKTEYEPEKPIHMPFATVNPVKPTLPENRREKSLFPRSDAMNQNRSNRKSHDRKEPKIQNTKGHDEKDQTRRRSREKSSQNGRKKSFEESWDSPPPVDSGFLPLSKPSNKNKSRNNETKNTEESWDSPPPVDSGYVPVSKPSNKNKSKNGETKNTEESWDSLPPVDSGFLPLSKPSNKNKSRKGETKNTEHVGLASKSSKQSWDSPPPVDSGFLPVSKPSNKNKSRNNETNNTEESWDSPPPVDSDFLPLSEPSNKNKSQNDEAKNTEHVGLSFKLGSWADDLSDDDDEYVTETPSWYKKSSSDELKRNEKEAKSGARPRENSYDATSDSSFSGFRMVRVTKPKGYSARSGRRF